MTRPLFPEPRLIPALFEDMDQFSFSGLSSGDTATTDGERLFLRFPYDANRLEQVRRFHEAHWDKIGSQWSVLPRKDQGRELVEFLRQGGFVFGGDVVELLRSVW